MCRNEEDWSSARQSLQAAGKSTSTDDNANVIETIEVENTQLESIAVDAVTSSNEKLSKIIAIGVGNTSEVPVLSSFDMPTVTQ